MRPLAKLRRLVLIGPHPIKLVKTLVFLVGRRLRRRRLRRGYARLITSQRPVGTFEARRIDLPQLENLPAPLVEAGRRLCAEADRVVAHEMDYLGSGPVALGSEIDWHRDFKSGYRWEPRFYLDVEATRLDDDSDAKVPWELSRGHQLLTLARAWRLTRDRRYLEQLEAQLTSWLIANPPGLGINWTTPMELGFRATNWLWALGTVEPDLDPGLRARTAESLYHHALHIVANVEGTPYLRSNHYLGNILGLFAIGSSFPDDLRARRWVKHAHAAFEREIMVEVYEDGVGFEGSLSYHGLSLEMFLIARHIAARTDQPFSDRFDDRLRRMVDVVRSTRHADGRIPLFGDQDSGRLLPAGFARTPSHDHLVWLGASILNLGRALPGMPNEEVAWTLGIDAYRQLSTETHEPPAPPRAFSAGGVYVLSGGETHLVARCGDVGQHGGGGHAHNDLFSYELSHGLPFVVDAGTYAYTFDVVERHRMRSTAAHNVMMIDDAELNPLDPRQVFSMPQVAHPTVVDFRVGDRVAKLVVSHDGYARLTPPVEVRRTFCVQQADGDVVNVSDELHGRGRHRVETRIVLHPEVAIVVLEATEAVLKRDEYTLHIAFDVRQLQLTVVPMWVSESYGERRQSKALVARGVLQLPARIGYSFASGSVTDGMRGSLGYDAN